MGKKSGSWGKATATSPSAWKFLFFSPMEKPCFPTVLSIEMNGIDDFNGSGFFSPIVQLPEGFPRQKVSRLGKRGLPPTLHSCVPKAKQKTKMPKMIFLNISTPSSLALISFHPSLAGLYQSAYQGLLTLVDQEIGSFTRSVFPTSASMSEGVETILLSPYIISPPTEEPLLLSFMHWGTDTGGTSIPKTYGLTWFKEYSTSSSSSDVVTVVIPPMRSAVDILRYNLGPTATATTYLETYIL